MNPKLKKLFLLSIVLFSVTVKSQIISQFNWNSNPVLMSVVGPTAISAGATATSSPGGVGGTNGLNPGTPTASDINLTIPNTSGIFDIPNIDISIDYRRNESTASMITRGAFSFNTGNAAANFQVTFRVNNAGSPVVITSTIYPIPADATFRTYRFTYDNCSGIGTMYVNNTVVWSTPSPTANLNLYWVGDGNMIIGQMMDGANNNIPNLDNFIVQPYPCASGALPIELVNFLGVNENDRNSLTWNTVSEKNNDYFTLEKSIDGEHWQMVAKIIGAGTSTSLKNYKAYDSAPEKVINYYRLLQTDFDGQIKKFSIISIDNRKENNARLVRVSDYLGRDINLDSEGLRILYYSDGTVVKKIGP